MLFQQVRVVVSSLPLAGVKVKARVMKRNEIRVRVKEIPNLLAVSIAHASSTLLGIVVGEMSANLVTQTIRAGRPMGHRKKDSPRVKRECRFYAKGTCTKGDTCGYLHIDKSTAAPVPKVKPKGKAKAKAKVAPCLIRNVVAALLVSTNNALITPRTNK